MIPSSSNTSAKIFLRLLIGCFISTAVFGALSAIDEFVFANYIWSRAPFPDQKLLALQLERHLTNPLELLMFAVPFFVGATLSWAALKRLAIRAFLTHSLTLAVVSAVLFTVVGGLELSNDARLALGSVMTLPIVVLVLSALGLRYVARVHGT